MVLEEINVYLKLNPFSDALSNKFLQIFQVKIIAIQAS